MILDWSKTALIGLDMQKGLLSLPLKPHSGEAMLKRFNELMRNIKLHNGKAVFVTIDPNKEPNKADSFVEQPLPESDDPTFFQLPDNLGIEHIDLFIEKQGISSFYQTELDEYLQSNNIETVILCGISTHFVVDATGKDAYQLGYQVVFVEDVMGAPIEQLH